MSGALGGAGLVTTVALLASLALSAAGVSAQGSQYLALDDPRVLFLEYLIARGDVDDPMPNVRPLLQRDVLIALRRAARDTMSVAGRIARRLQREWEFPSTQGGWWRLDANLGAQAYSQGRRDLLQTGGSSGVEPYFDTAIALGQGPLVGVLRTTLEPRLRDDPDYRRSGLGGPIKDRSRFVDAYIAGQWHGVGLHSGQVARNWGPSGLSGIPISNYAYPRTDIALSLGNRTVRYLAIRAPLYDALTPGAGRRWFIASRLDVRVRDGINLALWEAGIVQRPRTSRVDGALLNPLSSISLLPRLGLGERTNSMVGLDATWRPTRRLMFQTQVAVDEANRYASHGYPDRYGLSALAAGALGSAMSWRASYTMNSSLAYTTADPNENFTDAGVGIGRNFIDNDQYSLSVTVPVRANWLVIPELQLLRQGEGRLDRPWPDSSIASQIPSLWLGVRRDVWQAGLGVIGQARVGNASVRLSAQGGVQLSSNAFHVPGKQLTLLVGRLQTTIGWWVGRQDEDQEDPVISPSAPDQRGQLSEVTSGRRDLKRNH